MSIRITNAREVFFNNSKEQHLDFIKAWKEKAQKKESLSPLAHLVYSLLRGKPSTNGFSNVTNEAKLVYSPKQAIYFALYRSWSTKYDAGRLSGTFEGIVTTDQMVSLITKLKEIGSDRLESDTLEEISL